LLFHFVDRSILHCPFLFFPTALLQLEAAIKKAISILSILSMQYETQCIYPVHRL
jgi:hypothetical protein